MDLTGYGFLIYTVFGVITGLLMHFAMQHNDQQALKEIGKEHPALGAAPQFIWPITAAICGVIWPLTVFMFCVDIFEWVKSKVTK